MKVRLLPGEHKSFLHSVLKPYRFREGRFVFRGYKLIHCYSRCIKDMFEPKN